MSQSNEVDAEFEMAIKKGIRNVRDRALASGMKSICRVVLDTAKNERMNDRDKLESIIDFCKRSLGVSENMNDEEG